MNFVFGRGRDVEWQPQMVWNCPAVQARVGVERAEAEPGAAADTRPVCGYIGCKPTRGGCR